VSSDLWVSSAYPEGYRGAYRDPLISLGTSPLDDALFRATLSEQLAESTLEPAATPDVAGKDHGHRSAARSRGYPRISNG